MLALLKFMTIKQFKTAGFWIGLLLPIIVLPLFTKFVGSYSMQFAGIMIAVGVTIAIILGWGQVFSSIKTSSLLKGIRTSNIRRRDFFVIGFITSLIMFVVVFVLLLVLFIILLFTGVIVPQVTMHLSIATVPEVPNSFIYEMGGSEYMALLDWGALIGGFINLWILSSLLAFFFSSISKTQVMYQSISWGYMLLAVFFSGMIIPVELLRLPTDSDETAVEYTFITLAHILPTSFANFFIADVFQAPLWDLVKEIDYQATQVVYHSDVSPYSEFMMDINWWVPLIYDTLFSIGGLYLVKYWS